MIKNIVLPSLIALSSINLAQASVHQLPISDLPLANNVVHTTLSVELAAAATVNIYRGKHLVYSQSLKAGRHVIDPAALPMGAYEVKVDIVQAGKTVHSFKQYFLKEVPKPSEIQRALNVQLLEPATVKVLRDDKLLYHFNFKQAGFYKIDTTKFPAGMYPVTISVKNDTGKYQYRQVVIFRKIDTK